MPLNDWLSLFLHLAMLSVISVGGAIVTTPDIHRFIVDEHAWLSDGQFTSLVAIAQTAPGPNILFVGLIGWDLGFQSGGGVTGGVGAFGFAAIGFLLNITAILLPSCVMAFFATQWAQRNRNRLGVRAFKVGMAPIVISLLLSTAWLLSGSHRLNWLAPKLQIVTLIAAILFWRTNIHILWMFAAGALAGILGLI
ncbi:MAG: chromate transporter [Betaproteobacteria bacterium]|jgi:chromate transporter|nr:chromate transporter [Betaproteobacteria bacterium]NBT67387.1 chromate transporter [Betaproteobacteria bacterium]